MSHLMAAPLVGRADVPAILDWLLHRAVDLSQASFGNAQLMSWTAGYLEIKVQQGFDKEFLRFFERVRIEDGSACARALRSRAAIVIEDIMADEEFTPSGKVLSRAGVRAVQSTPLISSSGALLGIVSTHFAAPHRPTRIELRELQHTAQIAANALIRVGAGRYSIHDRIKSSLMLLEQSREEITRADRLLLLSRGLCEDSQCLSWAVTRSTLCCPMFRCLPSPKRGKRRFPRVRMRSQCLRHDFALRRMRRRADFDKVRAIRPMDGPYANPNRSSPCPVAGCPPKPFHFD
jgi:hypothetical protein